MKNLYEIGSLVKDEDGCVGIIGIRYADSDFVTLENDAAHPNPKKCNEKEAKEFLAYLDMQRKITTVLDGH